MFQYHPDPLATGSITPSDGACVCCGAVRGLVYTAYLFRCLRCGRYGGYTDCD